MDSKGLKGEQGPSQGPQDAGTVQGLWQDYDIKVPGPFTAVCFFLILIIHHPDPHPISYCQPDFWPFGQNREHHPSEKEAPKNKKQVTFRHCPKPILGIR